MSIFSSIMGKIFGHHDNAAAGTTANAPAAGQPAATGAAAPAPTTSTAASTPAAAPAAAPSQPVDVDAVLTQMQANQSEQLNWRTSIVDLMKLLGLDSSLSARKELASELHYTGNTEDSAAMNIWLHKQVMQKLAENGGKVPDDLK
jgi:3-oxoacyl-ACP reductase-like protein